MLLLVVLFLPFTCTLTGVLLYSPASLRCMPRFRKVLCLIFLLVNFERIDGLMQLCADVQRLATNDRFVGIGRRSLFLLPWGASLPAS